MNGHLSSQHLSEWALGERTREMLEHVRGCSSCLAEVESFDEALAQFRMSVRQTAQDHFSAPVREAKPAPRRISWRRLSAAGLALAALLLAGWWAIPLNHRSSPVDSAAADAALLKQIDTDVSQVVPDSMEPLLRLVAWDTGSAGQSVGPADASGKTEKR